MVEKTSQTVEGLQTKFRTEILSWSCFVVRKIQQNVECPLVGDGLWVY
jgi:hypothetical protein